VIYIDNHQNFKGFCNRHAINEISFLQASLQSTDLTASNTTARYPMWTAIKATL
jgi:hypothetical protein